MTALIPAGRTPLDAHALEQVMHRLMGTSNRLGHRP
jgi:hypothetical protein